MRAAAAKEKARSRVRAARLAKKPIAKAKKEKRPLPEHRPGELVRLTLADGRSEARDERDDLSLWASTARDDFASNGEVTVGSAAIVVSDDLRFWDDPKKSYCDLYLVLCGGVLGWLECQHVRRLE